MNYLNTSQFKMTYKINEKKISIYLYTQIYVYLDNPCVLQAENTKV